VVALQMYEEIRNRHFSNVSSFLSDKAKALQTGYDVSILLLLIMDNLIFR